MSFEASKTAHPKGLWVLFGTEMWERFNFYGMRTVLSLYLAHALAMGEKDSSLVYGGFLGLCYLTPMLGGYVADNLLGNRICILIGGLLMALGQLQLFAGGSVFESNLVLAQTVTWCGLGTIILGNGFFKPNISSMVGSLYPVDQKNKLDAAFTIFYLGINIGALLGQTICPLVGDVKHGGLRNLTAFKWGFLAAGIAMLIACVTFYILKDKYVVSPDGTALGDKPKKAATGEAEVEKASFTPTAIGIAVFVFIGLAVLFNTVGGQNPIYSIIYGVGITLAGLILTDKSLTKVESQRIIVLYIVAFFVIFFWAAFEQAGSSLTFIADNQTDTHILGWEMPASMVQNFNGFFVIIFAFPASALWVWLQKIGKEPISPAKQALGLAFISIGYLIIAYQVKDLGTAGKLGVIWLVVLYLFQTWGELCLSPIGLSLVAKLAPKRFASLLMGVWFLSNASGYALAGTLGSILPPTQDKFLLAKEKGIDLAAVLNKTATLSPGQTAELTKLKIASEYPVFGGFQIHGLFDFFMVFVILTGVGAILLYALCPFLKKMMHGAG